MAAFEDASALRDSLVFVIAETRIITQHALNFEYMEYHSLSRCLIGILRVKRDGEQLRIRSLVVEVQGSRPVFFLSTVIM